MNEPVSNPNKLPEADGSECSAGLGETLAFYATQHPAPGQTYAGISTPAGIVYIRALCVDGLDEATDMEQLNETLLNTVDTEGL